MTLPFQHDLRIDGNGTVPVIYRNDVGVTFDRGGCGVISRPMIVDDWDPNTWSQDHEYRIYGDDREGIYSVVDEIDYQWAIAWRWCANVKKSRRNPLKTKTYLRRAVGDNANGQRLRTFTLYLHVEILKRTGIQPATEFHIICDHRDGDTMNCRRSNLRWATHSMNSRNIYGQYGYDLVEDVICPASQT